MIDTKAISAVHDPVSPRKAKLVKSFLYEGIKSDQS